MQSIEIRSYAGREGFSTVRDQWRQLIEGRADLELVHIPAWYEAFLEYLTPDADAVRFFVASSGGGVVAIIPLVASSARVCGVPVRTLQLPWHPHLLLADFVAAEGASASTFWPAVVQHLGHERGWDVLRLSNVLEGSVALACLREGSARATVVAPVGGCCYLPCEPEETLHARLSKKFRGTLRNARNKIGQLSGIEYRVTRDPALLPGFFEQFLEVEESGWKGTGGTRSAIALDARLRGFYRLLLDRLGPEGGCQIGVLTVDGRPISAQFCLVTGQTIYIPKIGYNEAFARLAPGHLMLNDLLQRCRSDSAIRFVNFISDAAWLRSWNPDVRTTFDGYVFNSTVAGTAARLLLAARRRVAASLGRGPARDAGPDAD